MRRASVRGLTIRAKLTAVAVTTLVAVAALAALGVTGLSGVNHEAETIYRDRLVPLLELKHVSDGLAVTVTETINKAAEGVIAPDAALATIREVEEKILPEWQAFHETNFTPEEEALTAEADVQLAAVLDELHRFAAEVEAAADPQAAFVHEDGPFYEYVDPLVETLEELSTLQQQVAEEEFHISQALYESRRGWLLTIAILAAVVVGGAVGLVTRGLIRQVGRFREDLAEVAAGDLTHRLDDTRKDELGAVATAVNGFLDRLVEAMRSIRGSADGVSSSSQHLSALSQQLASTAEETSKQAETAAAASEQVSMNVTTVATSSDEMSASISEIASSATQASTVATEAASAANEAHATVTALSTSSAEIGEVVAIITSIAEQTNLLALNATIESARAGEAGRGFAIVANEVKELAAQTASFTEEIAQKVERIQADSTAAVTAIDRITEVVGQVNELQATIASAVEEQSATTSEITRSVTEAATGTSQISENVNGVAQAAQETTHAAASVLDASSQLATLAQQVDELLGRFTLDGHLSRPERDEAPAAVIAPTPAGALAPAG